MANAVQLEQSIIFSRVIGKYPKCKCKIANIISIVVQLGNFKTLSPFKAWVVLVM